MATQQGPSHEETHITDELLGERIEMDSGRENRRQNHNGSHSVGPQSSAYRYDLPIIYFEPSHRNVSRGELIAGTIFLLLWIAFFTLGLFVPTEPLRNVLWSAESTSIPRTIGYFLAVGASYTLTNMLFLSCLASLLGCMAFRWQVGDALDATPAEAESIAAMRVYSSAVLRGFFLYLMFISGFLIVATQNSVTSTTLDQYIRIAGTMSIVGFVVGYDPNLLVRFIRRILDVASLPTKDTQAGQAMLRRPTQMSENARSISEGPT
jgi:hypothetical protein